MDSVLDTTKIIQAALKSRPSIKLTNKQAEAILFRAKQFEVERRLALKEKQWEIEECYRQRADINSV